MQMLQLGTGRTISRDKDYKILYVIFSEDMYLETIIIQNAYLKNLTMDVLCDISLDMDTSFLKQD